MTHRPRWWSFAILTVLLAVLAAACSDVDEGGNDGGATGSDGGTTTADCGSDTVNIAVNPWTGSAVNANVAKVLMEKELGCTVELVGHRRVRTVPGAVHGRPRRHARGVAVRSREGLQEVHRRRPRGHRRWRARRDRQDRVVRPDLHARRAPRAGDLGRAQRQRGSVRDGRDLAQGSDAGRRPELRVLRRRHRRRTSDSTTRSWWPAPRRQSWRSSRRPTPNEEPLLFYFYTPHWANQKYDLTAVELPAYTEECGQAAADETGGYACEYPEDVLYKAFNQDLQTKAPAAFEFLSAMSYDNAAQEEIALSIDVDGMDPADAAQAWIDANPDVWQSWLPTSS